MERNTLFLDWKQWHVDKHLTTGFLHKTKEAPVCGVCQFLWCKFSDPLIPSFQIPEILIMVSCDTVWAVFSSQMTERRNVKMTILTKLTSLNHNLTKHFCRH